MPSAPTIEHHDTREEWLTARAIGGSDCAKLVYGEHLAVYADKALGIHSDGAGDLGQMGLALESLNADIFERETGFPVIDEGQYTLYRHGDIPWWTCTPDRFFIHPEYGRCPLSLKYNTAGCYERRGYYEQLQHEIECTGCAAGAVSVIDKYAAWDWYPYPRNAEFISRLKALYEWFWGFVLTREYPPFESNPLANEVLKAIYPRDDGGHAKLPPEAVEWHRSLQAVQETIDGLNAQLRPAEERRAGLQSLFRAAMGTAATGSVDGIAYSLKTTKAGHRILRRLDKSDRDFWTIQLKGEYVNG